MSCHIAWLGDPNILFNIPYISHTHDGGGGVLAELDLLPFFLFFPAQRETVYTTHDDTNRCISFRKKEKRYIVYKSTFCATILVEQENGNVFMYICTITIVLSQSRHGISIHLFVGGGGACVCCCLSHFPPSMLGHTVRSLFAISAGPCCL